MKNSEFIGADAARPVPKKYQVIYADPPWPVDMVRFGKDKGKRFEHYPVMKVDAICKLRFGFFDTNAVLFLWATHTFLHDAFHVMQSWGFKYHSCITWAKDGGMVNWGLYRSTEFLLYGYRGACPRSALSGKAFPCLVQAERGRHSEKPHVFRELISSKFSGNKIELFARQRAEGWDAWGNGVCGIELKECYSYSDGLCTRGVCEYQERTTSPVA